MSAQHSGGALLMSRYPNSQTGFYEYPMYGNCEPEHEDEETEDTYAQAEPEDTEFNELEE